MWVTDRQDLKKKNPVSRVPLLQDVVVQDIWCTYQMTSLTYHPNKLHAC